MTVDLFFNILPFALAGLIAALARRKGRSMVGWFIYGLFFSIIALIHVLLISNNKKTRPTPRIGRPDVIVHRKSRSSVSAIRGMKHEY